MNALVISYIAGGALLRPLAAAMAAIFGSMAVLARLRGEEFVALLPGSTVQAAAEAAERLRRIIGSDSFQKIGHSMLYLVSTSVTGMEAVVAVGMADVDTLLYRADNAMRPKRRGVNV